MHLYTVSADAHLGRLNYRKEIITQSCDQRISLQISQNYRKKFTENLNESNTEACGFTIDDMIPSASANGFAWFKATSAQDEEDTHDNRRIAAAYGRGCH